MKCPFCNAADTRVIDSRPADDNASIRRRRQCETCGKRFTTYEKLETMPLMIVKKDNSREPYERSKIEAGIIRSCHKRPVSSEQISRSASGSSSCMPSRCVPASYMIVTPASRATFAAAIAPAAL